jgi:hypothetical protein
MTGGCCLNMTGALAEKQMKIETKRLTGSLPFVAERSIPYRGLLSSEDLRALKNSLFQDHGSLPAQQNSFHIYLEDTCP